MNLVNIKETVEIIYEFVEDPKPIFVLRKLTSGEVQQISDNVSAIDDKNRLLYLGGTSNRLKIKFALVGWRNVTDDSGKDVPCNDVNKEKLPPGISLWLSKKIDEMNKLGGLSEEEKKDFLLP